MKRKIKKRIKIIFILLILIILVIGSDQFYFKNKPINIDDKKSEINNTKKENIETNKVKLTLVGDFLFEQPFYDAINSGYNKEEYFSLVKKYFIDDDLSIGNMEVVIGNSSLKTSGVGYNFCAPEYIGDLVNTLDLQVLGTANNHAFDRGKSGILSTLNYFKNNTYIKTVGTRENNDNSFLLYIEKNGVKFGITAYTYGTNQKTNSDDRKLINYYKDENGNINKESIKGDIQELKENSDVVIVLMHWGLEFRYNPNNEQKELANYLNELGVDIIVGSHSHNISPIEKIQNKNSTLVYYSLGNFVSHDDDIARTPIGEEEFDNAYQFGLLSTLEITKSSDKINIDNVKTNIIVNYFDNNMSNFKLIPLDDYSEDYEKSHFRYNKGLTKEFIYNTYNKIIDEKYRNI